ncbi:MAG: zf-TFIIB domain-containing protein [Pseudomonadota bacterium]
MKCPVCSDVDLAMSDRQGIEIDYCPKCRGVWLDRGELDKIIERSNSPVTESEPRYADEHGSKQHSHGSRDHEYYKKKKKGGLLGELFDF